MSIDKSKIPEEWLKFAKADLAIAKIDLPPDAKLELLCFHAQQAVEKAIKSVLIKCKLSFPYTHDIRALMDLLPEGLRNSPALKYAEDLSVYAVAPRYPSNDQIAESEYEQDLAIAEAVVAWAETIINKS
jgi:HEPN domain-containing protein